MQYYPLFLDIRDKPVLLIGGGNIAYEKVLNLLKAGAKITIVSPDLLPPLARFNKRVTWIKKWFDPSDIRTDYFLVFGATGDSSLNSEISKLCLQKRILCNTVDDPKYCHFIVPSILRRGKLTLAISTAGVSPTLAKSIKSTLKLILGPEYTVFTRWVSQFRQQVLARIPTLAQRMAFWNAFYSCQPLDVLREQGREKLTQLGEEILVSHEGR